jgi:hypothetical protein
VKVEAPSELVAAVAGVLTSPEIIVGGRFRILRQLGAGGMATVYEVLDLAAERRLALKRLHTLSDVRKRRSTIELFEREFHTLSHLSHPRVVQAFDYGVDEFGPYYTMELLDGSELQDLTPLPWRRACALARDICSALSLVHSRRLVYRDLNPRNVRCTSDGLAKLIDFGAMCPMGPSKQLVGTPAYCAPEAVDFQPLDARTDLYSLGATLYFVLTARHAYPAKSFNQLRTFWESQPTRPADLVKDIPVALDALVMNLLHPDPGVRSANAAEVMEQLAVIEGRTFEELPQVSSAYLSAPTLVARQATLTRVRAKLARALHGRGGGVLIEGAAGVGRSRLLTACLLEGKLAGALTLHADASDAETDYGVLRALCAQLIDAVPDVTHQAAAAQLDVLGHALPQLWMGRTPTVANTEDPNRLRAAVMTALKDWWSAIAKQRPLLITVDDLHAIDEPSAAALALLCHEASKHALLIVASAESSALATGMSALKLFGNAAGTTLLENLSEAHAEELLRSVFGDVPHVQMVAHKLHAISSGNPRDLMQLAQYLVDQQLASYRAGAWSLPANIDASALPSSMAQALRTRIAALGTQSLALGRFLALSSERGVGFDECVALLDTKSAQVIAALDELQSAQLIARVADAYSIPQRAVSAALLDGLCDDTARAMHARLSELFARRGDEEFRCAEHLLRAGQERAGLDRLIVHAETSQRATDNDATEYFKLTKALPEAWFQTFERGLALCRSENRPRRDAFVLEHRLVGLVDVMNVPGAVGYVPLRALLDLLHEECGLRDYEQLDAQLEPMQRLQRAFEVAKERYAQRSDAQRVFEPIAAIRQLVRASIASAGLAAKNIDYELLCSLPNLAPFEALSPAIVLAHKLSQGVGARITGRMEAARATYKGLVDLTAQPGTAGLGDSNHRYLRFGVMFGLGTIEAGMGLDSSLTWASEIEAEPMHQVNAQLVRLLHHLWQGQVREADRLKEEIELLRIRNSPKQWLEGAHLLAQVAANAASDDLTRIKRTVLELEPLAARQAPWVPVHDYATGEYHRIRGDFGAAASVLSRVLSKTSAGRHQVWSHAAGAHTRVLFELGEDQQACESGQRYLEQAERAELGYMVNYIKMPLSLALVRSGDSARGTRYAQEAISSFEALGTRGLNLVLAYETRARIAVFDKKPTDYEHFAGLCGDQARSVRSRLLATKHEKLKQLAVAAEVRASELTLSTEIATTRLGLTSILAGTHRPAERSEKSLELLLHSSGARAGALFLLTEQGIELAAQLGTAEVPEFVSSYVTAYLDMELHGTDLNTQDTLDADGAPEVWTSESGERYRPVLLSHQAEAGFMVSGVAVMLEGKNGQFQYPGSVASHLSRLAAQAGDAVPRLIE